MSSQTALLLHACFHVQLVTTAAHGILLCRGEQDRLWASVLFGKPCFVQVPTAYQAVIDPLQQFEGDPARYHTGTSIGTVGVMFENRRRNLLNGVITNSASGKLQMDVYQALGNCPKYIQGNLWQRQQHMCTPTDTGHSPSVS